MPGEHYGSIFTLVTTHAAGNKNVANVAHAAGWGVAGVLGSGPADEDALSAKQALVEMCGPVIIDPHDKDYIGATLGIASMPSYIISP